MSIKSDDGLVKSANVVVGVWKANFKSEAKEGASPFRKSVYDVKGGKSAEMGLASRKLSDSHPCVQDGGSTARQFAQPRGSHAVSTAV
jgi:hypothetical protein